MNKITKKRLSPPIAPMALRIGVVGHRPDRLGKANIPRLSEVIKKILDEIRTEVLNFQVENPGLYGNAVPVLHAISPLAEGTDRIFAQQALDAGYKLCCIMPFPEEEFMKDFEPGKALEPDSLNQFQRILERAGKEDRLIRFELDGNRKNNSLAYANCGKTILNQSDLLIVIWDGEFHGKQGGTESTLMEALGMGIPVIWIDAKEKHGCQYIKPGEKFQLTMEAPKKVTNNGNFSLKEIVNGLLNISDEPGRHTEKSDLEIYFNRHEPVFMMAVIWKCFRDIFGDGKFPKPVFKLIDFEVAVKDEWPEDKSDPVGQMVNTLRPYYAWPDKLAVLYSDRYRSAFIVTFFLAALAVGLALLPIASGWGFHTPADITCIAIEMLMILLIIGNVYFCRRNNWHGRWIDYRIIAESIRHLRLVAPLGGGRPFLQPPEHLKAYGQPESTWVAWYVRAVERSMCVPTVEVNKEHLLSSLNHLSGLIDGQIRYHENNTRRCSSIDGKLHRIGLILLVLTFFSCFIHFASGLWLQAYLPSWLSPQLMVFLCGFLPALGAAMAGINNQGEFTRISKRSAAMHDQLKLMEQAVRDLKEEILQAKENPEEPYSIKTNEIISKTARLLTNEVLDWRVVFLDRPLNASV